MMMGTCRGWAPSGHAPRHNARVCSLNTAWNLARVIEYNPWHHSASPAAKDAAIQRSAVCTCRRQHRRWCSASAASGSADFPANNRPDSSSSSSKDTSSGQEQQQPANTGLRELIEQESRAVDEQLKSWDPELEVQKQYQLLQQRLQQFRQPSNDSAVTPTSGTVEATHTSEASNPGQPANVAELFARWPLVTYGLFAWTWVLFCMQWAPLIGPLFSPAASASEWAVKVLGLLLLVPNTQASMDWQLDLLSWLTGEVSWMAPLSAAALHSGVLPTWLFSRSLLDAGSIIEGAYGPLVMLVHLMTASWSAALFQLLFNPVPVSITGPGTMCGLYCGLAVLLAREQRALRKMSGAAVVADEDRLNERLLSIPVVSRPAVLTLVCALLLGWFQPMLGIWGVIGGCVGGFVAGLSSVFLVKVLALGVLTVLNLSLRALVFLLRLPASLLRYVYGLVVWLIACMKDAVQGFRRM